MHWTRLDSLTPYDLSEQFSYIREEAECQSFDNDYDTDIFVRNLLEQDFASFYSKIHYDDIEIEYYGHELLPKEDHPTYAVYIYLNQNAITALQYIYPEYFI